MTRIVDYSVVLETLTVSGLRCVYHNSGAFGLPSDSTMHACGWIGPEDSTIRADMLARAKRIDPPYEENLAAMLCAAWTKHLPGPIWVMPASHWAYELQFGGADWLPGVLRTAGIDPELLRGRSDGSAIEFADVDALREMVTSLFQHMLASDFTVAFPGKPVTAMLHHHKQIWWQTSDLNLIDMRDER